MMRAGLFALVLSALFVEVTPFAWIVHCGGGPVAHQHLRKRAEWAQDLWPSHRGGVWQRGMKALMLPSMCSASAGEFARSRALGEALEEEERGERWETAIEEVRERSGWREGETFVFGYGALLSTSVFTRRGVNPSDGGRRAFVRCTAPGLFLTFRLKGGWSTLDELAGHNINTREKGANMVDDSKADGGGGGSSSSSSSSSTGSLGLPEPREAHGVIIPLSKEEISLLAQKEGGYTLTGIEVLPYGHAPGSQSTVSAVFFRANEWRRLPRPVLPTPRYRSLILAGAQEQQLDESYVAWIDQFKPASPRHMAEEHFATTVGDYATGLVVFAVSAAIYSLL